MSEVDATSRAKETAKLASVALTERRKSLVFRPMALPLLPTSVGRVIITLMGTMLFVGPMLTDLKQPVGAKKNLD